MAPTYTRDPTDVYAPLSPNVNCLEGSALEAFGCFIMHPSEPVLERGAHLALAASSLPVLEPAQSSGTGNCGANLPGRVTTVPRPITLVPTKPVPSAAP